MDSERVEILRENFDKFCAVLKDNKDKLLSELCKVGYFSDYLGEEEIEIKDIDEKLILNQCLNNIENYDKLVEVLLHIGCDEMALTLDENVIDLTDLNRCDPKYGYIEKFSFYENENDINEKCELVQKEPRSDITFSDIYNMRDSPRGYCLLINNFFTKGTYKEMQKFRNIFYQLHFDVIMEKNLRAEQIRQKLIDISKDENVKKHNAFIFMIITHGNSNREIYGFDEISLKIDSLIELLNNRNCEALRNKPKIFFFNCCRADKAEDFDLGVDSLCARLEEHQKLISQRIPTQDEVFVCFSTLEGYLSHVDRKSGTAFGEALSQAFIEKSYKNLNDILTKANRLLRGKMVQKYTREKLDKWYENDDDKERAKAILFKYASRIFSWELSSTRNVWFNLTQFKTIH